MFRHAPTLATLLCILCLAATESACSAERSVNLPAPATDAAPGKGIQTAVFAGGCFWGVEAVFRHTKGVQSAVSGYAGGDADTAHYEIVGSGRTGHAESVQVTYDPAQVSYGQLLQIFFSVAHDPTQVNRQGPDFGSQYRSVIFYRDAEQKRVAQAYIDQLNAAKVFAKPIATQLVALPAFYKAEDYHQDYAARNPMNPYIVFNDAPKVASLKALFPNLYTDQKRS
jgi:peptide-methionine (S)-S-oxide reductase